MTLFGNILKILFCLVFELSAVIFFYRCHCRGGGGGGLQRESDLGHSSFEGTRNIRRRDHVRHRRSLATATCHPNPRSQCGAPLPAPLPTLTLGGPTVSPQCGAVGARSGRRCASQHRVVLARRYPCIFGGRSPRSAQVGTTDQTSKDSNRDMIYGSDSKAA